MGYLRHKESYTDMYYCHGENVGANSYEGEDNDGMLEYERVT